MDEKKLKFILIGTGVAIFLIAGFVTMLLKPNAEPEKIETPTQIQQSEVETQTQPKVVPAVHTQPKPEMLLEAQEWHVYITGEVKKPGVYSVAPNSRIYVVVKEAGGFTDKADRTSVNLAAALTDGAQIDIKPKNIQTTQTQVQTQTIPGLSQQNQIITNSNTGSAFVNINTATLEELQKIKGVGPKTAEKIIKYRNSHGSFSRPEDLIKVRGIGENNIKKMLPQIVVR